MNTDERMRRMMDVVENEMPEHGRIKIHWLLNDCHEDEYSANARISSMEPVAYLGVQKKPSGMHEYLSMMGMTPEVAYEKVNGAWENAKSVASEQGIDAPKLNANKWDAYWCVAMMLADYWATTLGCADTAAMLAYQYLSDPDRKPSC